VGHVNAALMQRLLLWSRNGALNACALGSGPNVFHSAMDGVGRQ
jgi:hypothetical protein